MAIIEFLSDEKGHKQVYELLRSIAQKAKTDKKYSQLFAFIMRGLLFLENSGLPHGAKKVLADLGDEKPITFTIVKELKHHPPLLEFRINWRNIGGFRAIFFEHVYNGEHVLIFTRAMIKTERSSPQFERLIEESERMLKKFLVNPDDYLGR